MAGRIGAIIMARRRAKLGPRRRKSEEELDRLRNYDPRVIKDNDIKETTLTRLRFRKIPWPYWIIGMLFIIGGLFCFYLVFQYGQQESMFSIDSKLLMSYSIIIFMLVIGYLFVINGRVKTTIFDKRSGLLTEAKYPLSYYISCGKNLSNSKVKTYRLRDIKSVRAAQRGINRGSMNTLHYKVVIEFEN